MRAMIRSPGGAPASRATDGRRPNAVQVHSAQAGEFVASYESYERDPYESCFAYSRMRLAQVLNRYLPSNGAGLRVLDVGCGTGHHLAALAARGFSVVGIDGSTDMLTQARQANPDVELHEAAVDALPVAAGAFDFVLCIEVLRYLPDPQGCIAEMARALRPGGVCLATAAPLFSVNGYALVNRLALVAPLGDLVRLKQYFTTPSRISTQCEVAGFSPVEVHGVYAGPINWIEHVAPNQLPSVLRRWEQVDREIADRPRLRGLSNMLLVKARRAA
jgi:SAM-dependent methyltransferase